MKKKLWRKKKDKNLHSSITHFSYKNVLYGIISWRWKMFFFFSFLLFFSIFVFRKKCLPVFFHKNPRNFYKTSPLPISQIRKEENAKKWKTKTHFFPFVFLLTKTKKKNKRKNEKEKSKQTWNWGFENSKMVFSFFSFLNTFISNLL